MTVPDANSFIAALLSRLEGSPFEERVLLAPSYRVGRQWLDRAAAARGGIANVRLATVARLLLDFARPALRRMRLRPGGAADATRLAGMALSAMAAANPGEGYFTRLPPSVTLARAIASSLAELGDAGVRGGEALGGKLVSREKADELAGVLRRCRAGRKEAGLAGPADIGGAALQALRAARERGGALPMLLIPESVLENAGNWERRFIDAWPDDKKDMLPEDDASLPVDAAFFHADCPANEVREVLRRIQAERIALDRVEIVCVDPASYIPVLCGVAGECFGGKVEDLPFTFNAGVPGNHARPVRLALAWLAWLEDDMPPAGLADMIEAGLVDAGWRGAAPTVGRSALAARLKALAVNAGPGDYARELGSGAEGDMREAEHWLARWLLATTPLANGGRDVDLRDAGEVLRAAERLLAPPFPDEGKLDAYARTALLDAIAAWLPAADWEGFDAAAWLRETASGLMLMGLGPMPGRAHVSDIGSGGHSGRDAMFVVGFDDTRFPGSARQDPVLLDKERARISRKLGVSAARRERREKAMRRFLARCSGRTVFSHADMDVGGGRELRPAALYVRLRGEGGGEGGRAVLRPDVPDKCLNRRDDWLWDVLAAPRNSLTPAALLPWRPHLAAGDEAARERMSPRFSRWDGRVPEAGEDYLREGWVLSPSQLEMLARCPLDFFFRKVLGVRPPDRYEFLPGRWLRGNERGELLHDLFQDFMMRVDAENVGVVQENYDRLREMLMDMLDRSVRRRRRRSPPRDELAYERDRRDLTEACVIFLFRELERAARGRPVSWEAALGGAEEDRPPWHRVEPVALELPSGRSVLLQGRVDRIDRLHGHGGLEIWDYKTGRASDFSRVDPFRQGRHLQPYLYSAMLERVLREAGRGEPVLRFAYFFPMRRDEGGVIAFERDDLRGGGEIVGALAGMLAAGCFPFTTREEDVRYSDYLPVYGGDVKALCGAARLKAGHDAALSGWSGLRGD